MDPLTALSLASSVVQFVDFGTKVALGIREIYNSKSGQTARIKETIEAVERMKSLNDELSPVNMPTTSPAEKTLAQIATKCRETSAELISITEGLVVPEDTRSRLFSSFKIGVKATWKKEKISELVDKMDSLRAEMTLNIVTLVKYVLTLKLRSSLTHFLLARGNPIRMYY